MQPTVQSITYCFKKSTLTNLEMKKLQQGIKFNDKKIKQHLTKPIKPNNDFY